jgi:hypothetical protein
VNKLVVAAAAGGALVVAGLVVAVVLLAGGGSGAPRSITIPAAVGPPALPPRNAVVLAQEDGSNALTLAAVPERIRITLFNGEGNGVTGADVTVGRTRTTTCGAGCYEARTNIRGRVPVRVDGRVRTFVVPRAAPDASALMARASRTFHALRSVTYVERLASSPRDKIVSTFTLEAPDRVEYHIRRGGSAIVIGTRRWDRGNGRWIKSQSTYLPQPTPIWGTPITNAHVLERQGNEVTVSWLNPKVPAWFVARFDTRTLHPHSLEMTATAHFMHHVYSGFDASRRIFPPR